MSRLLGPPGRPLQEETADDPMWSLRLGGWLVVVGLITGLGYYGRVAGDDLPDDYLYTYEPGTAGLIMGFLLLTVVVVFSFGRFRLLALRNPPSWLRAIGLSVVAVVAGVIAALFFDLFLDGGAEQGITTDTWDPTRAGIYAFNFVVIATAVPIAEELLYRGLGYSLLSRWGVPVAIGGSALAFGLSHGLVEGLPTLVAFGLIVGWLRYRTDIIVPCIAFHACFNAIALLAAVWS